MKSKYVESANYCKNCKYFRRHYALNMEHYYFAALNYGHCVYPRQKNRDAETEACQHWEQVEMKQ